MVKNLNSENLVFEIIDNSNEYYNAQGKYVFTCTKWAEMRSFGMKFAFLGDEKSRYFGNPTLISSFIRDGK